MTVMLQAYAFNLAPQRFDTHVAAAFTAAPTRFTRDRLIAEVREGRLDHMLLKRLDGLEALPDAANERAALNIIDYNFEPLVMKSMTAAQASHYFQAVEKTVRQGETSALEAEGPLWIDTVHHSCVFSVLFRLAALLGQHYGYHRLVLLHQGQRPEPRLGIIGNLLRQIPGVEPVFLKLDGSWFQQLTRLTTPNTAVFYLTDMPGEAFQRPASKSTASAQLQLYAEPGVRIDLETLSGSAILARKLRAAHVVVEYPSPDRIRIRPFDAAKPVALCPLEDWVFWPLMDVRR